MTAPTNMVYVATDTSPSDTSDAARADEYKRTFTSSQARNLTKQL